MARQKGIIKIDGTIGDITFYRSKDGYMAREKGGVSGDRIMNDPAFQRTRENGAEFGRAGKAGKMLRNSIQNLLRSAKDTRMVGRLTKAMVKVIQMDAVNPRGLRNVIDGEAELLEGFEFNINGKLSTTLFAPSTKTLDRVSGNAKIDIPAFVPTDNIIAPGGSTHYKIVGAGMEIDFEGGTYVCVQSETAMQTLDNVLTTAIELDHALPPNSTHPLFLVLGISFYQEVNGEHYVLKNGSYNALQIVKVVGT